MIYSEKGLALTKESESLQLKAYADPGTGGAPWTIGYGHTGPHIEEGMTISQEEADHLLLLDVQESVDAVNKLVTVPITQDQFDALVDFTFNVGAENFEKSTLLIKLNKGDTQGAADEFPRWNRAAGHVLGGLIRRRGAERTLFLTQE
jgi:lysozyme